MLFTLQWGRPSFRFSRIKIRFIKKNLLMFYFDFFFNIDLKLLISDINPNITPNQHTNKIKAKKKFKNKNDTKICIKHINKSIYKLLVHNYYILNICFNFLLLLLIIKIFLILDVLQFAYHHRSKTEVNSIWIDFIFLI